MIRILFLTEPITLPDAGNMQCSCHSSMVSSLPENGAGALGLRGPR